MKPVIKRAIKQAMFVGVACSLVTWMVLLPTATMASVRLPDISPAPDALARPFAWEVSGYMMLDGDSPNQKKPQYNLRRLSLETAAKQNHWAGELQLRLEDAPEIQDLTLTYLGFGDAELEIGRMKIPSGLEADVSSRHLPLIERSIATEQTALGRGNGVALSFDENAFGFKLGSYDVSDWNDQVFVSALRAYASPINKKRQQVHLGMHLSVSEWQKGRHRLRSQFEIESSDDIRLTPAMNPKKIHQAGLELAYQYTGWLAQLEYTRQDIQVYADANQTHHQYQFIYYQVAWLPFGQHRRYRDGVFKGVSGKASLTKIEAVVRHSEVDAFDRNAGTLARTTTLGVNWYCLEDAKLMLNYGEYEWEQAVVAKQQSGDNWSARLQWEFAW